MGSCPTFIRYELETPRYFLDWSLPEADRVGPQRMLDSRRIGGKVFYVGCPAGYGPSGRPMSDQNRCPRRAHPDCLKIPTIGRPPQTEDPLNPPFSPSRIASTQPKGRAWWRLVGLGVDVGKGVRRSFPFFEGIREVGSTLDRVHGTLTRTVQMARVPEGCT